MGTELLYEELLGILGIDASKKDMVVLGALLKAQEEPADYIDFETLREQLAKDEGSRRGKDPLIYRSLSWLEKEGFVKIDISGHKHGYNSSIATIETALERIVNHYIASMQNDLKQIDSEVNVLSEMNSETLASGLIDMSAGKSKIEKPVFAQGINNILNLLDEKVYKGLKKGDVVRITIEWLSQGDYLDARRILSAEKILKKGVELRALDHDRSEKQLRKDVRISIINWRKEFEKVGYRVFPRKDATYQFVSRNTEGIMLVVSENPLSATWLPKIVNPELVDNAIESFDSDYNLGTDILDFQG
ncbi:MAG: hypothetical protein ACFFCX_08550 [Candidatus Sifarchaeia archaeon]